MLLRSALSRAKMSTSTMSLSHDFSLSRILSKKTAPLKKTKLICTIGPTSDHVPVLEEMIKSGLNVARINFSHDDHEIQYQKLCRIREAIKNVGAEGQVGIMLDTKGPEIRTGILETKKIQFNKGDKVKVTPDYSVKCNQQTIAVSYPSLLKSVAPGKMILIADGNLALKVLSIDTENNCLETVAMNSFLLGERKNVNLPGVKVDLPVITEKDRHDIVDFGIKHDVDFIALSFTRTASCVQKCREVLGESGKHIHIIPKIENEEGLENLEEILNASDGIMMARGDLGMEVHPSKVLLAQKYMTSKSRQLGKPVICATQMLESMTDNPRPTRAEMSDVGNAVLDSVDTVMLSGETGNGVFIEESVNTMVDICKEVEMAFDYSNYYKHSNRSTSRMNLMESTLKGLASSAVKLSLSLECECIIILSEDQQLAQYISNLRPNAYIIFPNQNEQLIRKLSLNFGVYSVKSDSNGVEDCMTSAKKFIQNHGLLSNYKNVVVVNTHDVEVRIINI